MLHDWYRAVQLPMSLDEFHRLPRNPAYKYEYADGMAHLLPRPKTLNGLLDLQPLDAPQSIRALDLVTFRPLQLADWAEFPDLFTAAFRRVPPFAGLSEEERLQASIECLEQTRTGGDGPPIASACFVAESRGQVLAGILVTLIPKREPGDWWDGHWLEPPPQNAAKLGLARAHLTWVFVTPAYAGYGIGSVLLAHAANALLAEGFLELATTFLVGNEASTLWHWRNGFRLLPYPGSMRRISQSG